ncbi:hypothetical protein FS749_007221 [Ceratobasidium sp. UAMH 11750]|nr:hypothetical protein FS749_007221 [Ceratobasidium sp. UAMH 11750]
MSHSLHWSSKAHFYPLGNTPPVCLTQDLSPEQSADILLLGCGDPRHILFTLYADLTVPQRPRPLTFTCCDLDPAILARNVILLTLLDDGAPVDSVWDIFYHFQIGDVALSLLVRHCHKLLAISSSPQNWRESPYGSFLKFFDARTLDELRRHWSLYAEFPKLRKVTLNKFREQKDCISTSVLERREVLFVASLMASRSAGPLLPRAVGPVTEALVKYWKTGTIHQRPEDIKKARHLNPTFIYSLSGEMFNIHYGTFPQGSHFAPVLAPLAPKQPGFTRMLQFNTWVRAFQASRKSNAINIWLYAGDALAFCHALREHSRTGRASTNMPIAPWRAAQIDFNQITADHTPPSAFDIIDTSNLTDHLGLLNILVGAQPLLKIQPVSQSVLYTESLILSSKSVTDSLQSRLKTTMSTVGLLLGLIPHPYLAGFTTQSHTEELMMSPETHGNYRERIAWVHPASGDPHFRNQGQPRLTLYPKDLAVLLADMFGNMFPNKRFPLRSLFFKSSPIAMREENLL